MRHHPTLLMVSGIRPGKVVVGVGDLAGGHLSGVWGQKAALTGIKSEPEDGKWTHVWGVLLGRGRGAENWWDTCLWGQGRAESLQQRFEQSNHSDRRRQRDGRHRQGTRGAGRVRTLPVRCFYVSMT